MYTQRIISCLIALLWVSPGWAQGILTVGDGAQLLGTGTIAGLVVVESTGVVSPGSPEGCFSTLDFTASGELQLSLGEGTPCTGADQLQVTGAVDLSGATLSLSLLADFSPSPLQEFVLIENDGADAVTGNFSGLQEGATFTVDASNFSDRLWRRRRQRCGASGRGR